MRDQTRFIGYPAASRNAESNERIGNIAGWVIFLTLCAIAVGVPAVAYWLSQH